MNSPFYICLYTVAQQRIRSVHDGHEYVVAYARAHAAQFCARRKLRRTTICAARLGKHHANRSKLNNLQRSAQKQRIDANSPVAVRSHAGGPPVCASHAGSHGERFLAETSVRVFWSKILPRNTRKDFRSRICSLGLVRIRRFSVAYLPRILLSGLVRKFATLRNPMDKVEHF